MASNKDVPTITQALKDVVKLNLNYQTINAIWNLYHPSKASGTKININNGYTSNTSNQNNPSNSGFNQFQNNNTNKFRKNNRYRNYNSKYRGRNSGHNNDSSGNERWISLMEDKITALEGEKTAVNKKLLEKEALSNSLRKRLQIATGERNILSDRLRTLTNMITDKNIVSTGTLNHVVSKSDLNAELMRMGVVTDAERQTIKFDD
jgi:hypothetical protein